MFDRIFKGIKKIIKQFIVIVLIGFLVVVFSSLKVSNASKESLFDDVSKIPSNRVGLVLGTSKFVKGGRLNQYFENRINAAVQLYEAGKIDYIIVSGDNSTKYYNEPKVMKAELIKRNVPAEVIYLDFAGFRTLDSVVRCYEIFGQDSFTVISQKFHNKRAVFIAKEKGYEVIAFNAKDVSSYYGFRTRVREMLARVKVIIDVYVINKKPKFLGEKIIIG